MDKNLPASARQTGSIPGPGRSHMAWSSWAQAPWLLKPVCLEPELCNKRSSEMRGWAQQLESSPRTPKPGKAQGQTWTSWATKKRVFVFFFLTDWRRPRTPFSINLSCHRVPAAYFSTVLPRFLKNCFMPLCFRERPTLVSAFANWNRSSENFHF